MEILYPGGWSSASAERMSCHECRAAACEQKGDRIPGRQTAGAVLTYGWGHGSGGGRVPSINNC